MVPEQELQYARSDGFLEPGGVFIGCKLVVYRGLFDLYPGWTTVTFMEGCSYPLVGQSLLHAHEDKLTAQEP